MYNADGSLDEGGQLLKNLYKKMFRENPGGVRIDHIVGLIDPWVYKAGKKPKIEQGAGRLYSSPEHPELSKYAIAKIEDLDMELTADKEKRVKTLSKKPVSYTHLDVYKRQILDKPKLFKHQKLPFKHVRKSIYSTNHFLAEEQRQKKGAESAEFHW